MLKSHFSLLKTTILIALVLISAAENEPSASSASSIEENTISSEVDACGKDVRKAHEEFCSKKHPSPPAGCTLHPKAVHCMLKFICKDCAVSVASETVKFMKKVAKNEDKCDHSAYADFECPSTSFNVLKDLAFVFFIVVPLIIAAVLLVIFLRKKYTEAQQTIAKSNSLSTNSYDSKTKNKRKKKKDKSTSKSDKSSDRKKKNRT